MEPLENKAFADKNEANEEQAIKGSLDESVQPKKNLLKGSSSWSQEDKETACRQECGSQCGEGLSFVILLMSSVRRVLDIVWIWINLGDYSCGWVRRKNY